MMSTTLRSLAGKRPAATRTFLAARNGRHCQQRYLTTATPSKPPSAPPKPGRLAKEESTAQASTPKPLSPPPPPPKQPPVNDQFGNMSPPPDVNLDVTPEMKRANIGLALALATFIGSVYYYSMMQVGGSQQVEGSDDPLARLKAEAQEAMDRQTKEQTPEASTQQLLQEFQRGDHDPDKAEVDALEEELEEQAAKKKKSWWKFW